MHLNNLHIQFDTVIAFLSMVYCIHKISLSCGFYLHRYKRGHLADGRGMINELQENIAAAKLQSLHSTKRNETKQNTHHT